MVTVFPTSSYVPCSTGLLCFRSTSCDPVTVISDWAALAIARVGLEVDAVVETAGAEAAGTDVTGTDAGTGAAAGVGEMTGGTVSATGVSGEGFGLETPFIWIPNPLELDCPLL